NQGPVPLAKRREDEVSVGSAPLAKQPSNQASDYASSPMKTKTVTGRSTKSYPLGNIKNVPLVLLIEHIWTFYSLQVKCCPSV
ncbi:Vacuolar protein sorting-associated protein 13B, partial [Goodea atripinnis]